MQKSAPLTVHYGRELQLAGQDLPGPVSVRVPTRHGPVRCELYLPAVTEPPPVYVHLHGGAFIMRHPRMDDFFARFLVSVARIAVLGVDYDVAPQVRYPVAHEQVHDVAAYVAARGRDLGLDGDRLAVGGFSAGGNLAASACLQARDRSSFLPRFQLLGVPSLDVAEEYAEKQPVGSPMLGRGIHDLVRATYFREQERRAEAYASPLRAANLADLPPTMVVTAERDLLRREGGAYAQRLTEARVPVQHRVVPGRDHYFLDRTNARTEMSLMAGALRRHLVDVRD
jgi:acetyl esterase